MNNLIRFLAVALLLTPFAGGSLSANEAVVVAEASGSHPPQQPQLAIDAKGAIHLAYGVNNDVYYVRSEDGGKTFSHPAKISTVRVLSLGARRGPRIAVSGDVVCISVIGGVQGKGRDGDLLLFRSTDKGRTWQQPVIVNDAADSAREGLHAMAASATGDLACVWLDLRNKKTEIFASFSRDQGKTWSKNVLVYRSPSSAVCECCHPSVSYGADGKLLVMWRNQIGPNRDMYLSTSTDGGKTFSKAQKLGAGSWPIDHCPMDGGNVVESGGKPVTVWRRDHTVYFHTAGSAKEVEIGHGEQPWVADSPAGPIVVWLTRRQQSLMLQEMRGNKRVELAKGAVDPVIASGGPRGEQVAVAWEDHSHGRRILCRMMEVATAKRK
jgi:hypothetical protein